MMLLPDIQKWAKEHPGTPQQQIASYYADLEGRKYLGSFVPISKVGPFIREAASTLALDYPVFTQFYERGTRP
jgi:hypothetical protein